MAVQGSVLNRLGQVIGSDRLLALEVGDGPSHLEDPIMRRSDQCRFSVGHRITM
jgi:hypothetical protein